jgi:hypothetical protein
MASQKMDIFSKCNGATETMIMSEIDNPNLCVVDSRQPIKIKKRLKKIAVFYA